MGFLIVTELKRPGLANQMPASGFSAPVKLASILLSTVANRKVKSKIQALEVIIEIPV